jgi:hypothetical protein
MLVHWEGRHIIIGEENDHSSGGNGMRRTALIFLYSAFVAIFVISGCTAKGSETALSAMNTDALPTAIPSLQPSETPSPTSLPTPTMGHLARTILNDAGQLCSSNHPSTGEYPPLEGANPEIPLITLFSRATVNENWEYGPAVIAGDGLYSYSPKFDFIEAITAASVKTIVCIGESQDRLIENYSDGQPAIKRNWFVWLVRWPSGELISAKFFWGDEPPTHKAADGKPGYGYPPIRDVQTWLMAAVMLPNNLIYTGYTPSTLAFSQDGNVLYVDRGSTSAIAWDLVNNTSLPVDMADETSTPAITSYNLTAPDGSGLVVRVWAASDKSQKAHAQIVSGEFAEIPDNPITIEAASISTDRRWLAVAAGTANYLDMPIEHTTMLVWDLRSGAVLATIKAFTPTPFLDVSFSADSKWLLLTGYGNTQLWDTSTWTMSQKFEAAVAAVLSPDGKMLALGDVQPLDLNPDPQGPALLDLETGNITLLETSEHFSWTVLVFSPDGQKLAGSYRGNFIKIWDIP